VAWERLSPEQKQVLGPYRERCQQFKQMSPDEQQRLRENFHRYRDLPPEQREQLREKSRNATPEEREQMREKAHARRRLNACCRFTWPAIRAGENPVPKSAPFDSSPGRAADHCRA